MIEIHQTGIVEVEEVEKEEEEEEEEEEGVVTGMSWTDYNNHCWKPS